MTKTHLRRSRNFLTLVLATLITPVLSAFAAIPSAEKLLPDDTLVVVTTPDFTKLRTIYKTSPQALFWDDPAMKPFKDHFLSKWREEFVQPLERELGIRLDDYTDLPQGQVTFALVQNGWDGSGSSRPAFLFLLDTRDKAAQLKKNLADFRKKWVDSGKPIKTEKIRDVEFSIFPINENDLPKTLKKFVAEEEGFETETNKTSKTELIIGQFESMLIVGDSLKPVEKVMVHATGGAMPSLGELAAYDANRLSLFRDSPGYAWANVKAFLDIFNRKSSGKSAMNEDPFIPGNPQKLLASSGLGAVKTVAFSFQNSTDGSLFQFFVGVPESTREGLFKLLPGDGKDSSPPPFVPADVVKFQRWRIDGQKTWATVEKIMGDFSPQWLGTLNLILDTANSAAKQKDPDFDLRKNLIGNLGDDLISYEKAPRSGSLADMQSPPSLFLIGSPHPEQLAAAMRGVLLIIGQQGGPPTEREFLGKKIYSAGLMPLPLGPAGGSKPRTLNYAASSGYVALTTDASILEEYLRSSDSQQKTLREMPGLTEAIARAGGSSSGWFGYENQAETARVTFETLRKSAAAEANSSPLMPGAVDFPGPGNALKEWMDFSLLPPFERISKYFYFNVYTVGANVDGISCKVFTPMPPGVKK